MMTKMKKGFTLAEVLITLGIIGIIATLTMPALVAKYQEKATSIQLKKFYSVMSQAYMQAIAENGDPTGWGLTNTTQKGAQALVDNITPYLKTMQQCNSSECLNYVNSTIAFSDDNTYVNAVLADGTFLAFRSYSPGCTLVRGTSDDLKNVCGIVNIDINGFKPPNKSGKDIFLFILSKQAVLPVGTAEDTNNPLNDCLQNMNSSCTAWIIFNENMDYLHCDDLSWNGKTKCD